ncbi:hypothetical protein SB749_19565, partial [Brevibacterium sp. SIMBA_078]|uniref:hypothetical protein n=1 Tax=Brevibacterium sp. SIMBA_078 TaxID=3085816 RepID=UPI0039789624
TKWALSSTIFFELFKQFKNLFFVEIVFLLDKALNILFQLIFLKIYRILNLPIFNFKKKENLAINVLF